MDRLHWWQKVDLSKATGTGSFRDYKQSLLQLWLCDMWNQIFLTQKDDFHSSSAHLYPEIHYGSTDIVIIGDSIQHSLEISLQHEFGQVSIYSESNLGFWRYFITRSPRCSSLIIKEIELTSLHTHIACSMSKPLLLFNSFLIRQKNSHIPSYDSRIENLDWSFRQPYLHIFFHDITFTSTHTTSTSSPSLYSPPHLSAVPNSPFPIANGSCSDCSPWIHWHTSDVCPEGDRTSCPRGTQCPACEIPARCAWSVFSARRCDWRTRHSDVWRKVIVQRREDEPLRKSAADRQRTRQRGIQSRKRPPHKRLPGLVGLFRRRTSEHPEAIRARTHPRSTDKSGARRSCNRPIWSSNALWFLNSDNCKQRRFVCIYFFLSELEWWNIFGVQSEVTELYDNKLIGSGLEEVILMDFFEHSNLWLALPQLMLLPLLHSYDC